MIIVAAARGCVPVTGDGHRRRAGAEDPASRAIDVNARIVAGPGAARAGNGDGAAGIRDLSAAVKDDAAAVGFHTRQDLFDV